MKRVFLQFVPILCLVLLGFEKEGHGIDWGRVRRAIQNHIAPIEAIAPVEVAEIPLPDGCSEGPIPSPFQQQGGPAGANMSDSPLPPPSSASQPDPSLGRRTVCGPYFYGYAATDLRCSGEMIDDIELALRTGLDSDIAYSGERQTYKVCEIRYPRREFNPEERWQTIYLQTGGPVPYCGTYANLQRVIPVLQRETPMPAPPRRQGNQPMTQEERERLARTLDHSADAALRELGGNFEGTDVGIYQTNAIDTANWIAHELDPANYPCPQRMQSTPTRTGLCDRVTHLVVEWSDLPAEMYGNADSLDHINLNTSLRDPGAVGAVTSVITHEGGHIVNAFEDAGRGVDFNPDTLHLRVPHGPNADIAIYGDEANVRLQAAIIRSHLSLDDRDLPTRDPATGQRFREPFRTDLADRDLFRRMLMFPERVGLLRPLTIPDSSYAEEILWGYPSGDPRARNRASRITAMRNDPAQRVAFYRELEERYRRAGGPRGPMGPPGPGRVAGTPAGNGAILTTVPQSIQPRNMIANPEGPDTGPPLFPRPEPPSPPTQPLPLPNPDLGRVENRPNYQEPSNPNRVPFNVATGIGPGPNATNWCWDHMPRAISGRCGRLEDRQTNAGCQNSSRSQACLARRDVVHGVENAVRERENEEGLRYRPPPDDGGGGGDDDGGDPGDGGAWDGSDPREDWGGDPNEYGGGSDTDGYTTGVEIFTYD